MKKTGFFKHLDFLLLDLSSLVIAIFVASLYKGNKIVGDYKTLVVLQILSFISVAYFYSPYKNILKRNKSGFVAYHFGFAFMQLMLVLFLVFTIKIGTSLSRLFVATEYVVYYILSTIASLVWKRHLWHKASGAIQSGDNSILVVTEKGQVERVLKDIELHNYNFFRIAGLCVIDEDQKGKDLGICTVLCNKEDLLEYACLSWVDGVYFEMDYQNIPDEILSGLAQAGISVHIRLRKIAALAGQEQYISNIFGNSVLSSSVKERTNKQIFMKKTMDILGGLVGSLICVLLTLIIGPIIKIKSPGGPIFYKQERIGLNGRRFYMYKFRSMVPDAEAKLKDVMSQNRVQSDLMFKMENDPRIIPVIGNFIRKTSLDEFPQFFNVLKGDMSLVGTRPPTVNEWEKYELAHRIRMATKPGITGMWQVSGRNQITDFNEVVKLDAYYINNWSVSLDISILFKTVLQVLHFGKDGEAM